MKVNFVVFHAGTGIAQTDVRMDRDPPKFEFSLFKSLMRIGRAALRKTCGTDSNYIVLTDKETAPFLKSEFDVRVCAPSGVPLMRQYVEAQANYLEDSPEPGLTVLAATDCAPGRDLRGCCKYGLGVTYRIRGRSHINNLAYVNDPDLGAWFLRRALSFFPETPGWYADQESWYKALGPFETWKLVDPEGMPDSTREVVVKGHLIGLLPCKTHNYFVKSTGNLSGAARDAWVLHYKGVKHLMAKSVNFFILNNGIALPNKAERRKLKRTLAAKKRGKDA